MTSQNWLQVVMAACFVVGVFQTGRILAARDDEYGEFTDDQGIEWPRLL